MNNEIFNDYISQGESLMAAHNYEAAKEAFQKALKEDNRSFEAYMHLGNALASLEKYDDAITAFKNALLIDENSKEALFSIGNVYFLMNNMLKAVEYFLKAESAGMTDAILYHMLSGIFMNADDTVQAMRYLNKAIAAAPLNGELRLYKIQLQLSEGNFAAALEELDEMQKILPDAFALYSLKTEIYSGMNDYEKALQAAEEGCARFPKDANLALNKLALLVNMAEDEKAVQFAAEMKENGLYEQAMKNASMQESAVYIRKGDTDKAKEILLSALEKTGDDADLLYVLIDLFSVTEQHEKVIEYSDRLIAVKPSAFHDVTARFFRANSIDKMGKTEEAKEEYRKLTKYLRRVTVEYNLYEAYIYRLLCHTRLGEYDKALELADYLEARYPERADSHTFRYFIYTESGEKEKARAEKAKAAEINPNVRL